MSAFMVSHACIHRVVVALRAHESTLRFVDGDLIGMQLIELNRRAVQALLGAEVPKIAAAYRCRASGSDDAEGVAFHRLRDRYAYAASEQLH